MRRYLSRRFENRLFGPIRGLMLRRFDAKRQHRETLFEPKGVPRSVFATNRNIF